MADQSRGGIRPPDYIHAMALARVEDLMLQGYSPRDIFARLFDEQYTESEETAAAWRQAVQRKWAAEDAEMRPAYKDRWRARIEKQLRRLNERAENTKSDLAAAAFYSEATKLMKLGIIVDGAQAPVQVQHTGSVDVAAMSPRDREAEIAELMAKRDAALTAARKAKREAGVLS